MAPPTKPEAPGADFYATYEEHAKTVRTWLVAYGVGVPALILGNQRVWNILHAGGRLKCVAILFLIGVGLQVTLSIINKTIAWINYDVASSDPPLVSLSLVQRIANTVSGFYGIDFLVDISTVVLFCIGTYQVFAAVGAAGPLTTPP
jgi:hypothetical protein